MEQIETKLDQGLDRSISAVIGWVKVYLQYEQKKTDYKPETDVDTISSAVRINHEIILSTIISYHLSSISGLPPSGAESAAGYCTNKEVCRWRESAKCADRIRNAPASRHLRPFANDAIQYGWRHVRHLRCERV